MKLNEIVFFYSIFGVINVIGNFGTVYNDREPIWDRFQHPARRG